MVNGSASFNQDLLKIQLSGDVHPEPGPETGSVNTTSNERLFSRRSTHKDISFFYASARSIVNKVDMFHLEVANKVYDVVVLVETHLDHGEIFPANYLVFRRDRMCNGRRGGGVLIAVRVTFKSSLRDDMLSDSELIFVDISFPNDRKITVGAFYRSPNADTNPILDMQDVLQNSTYQDLVIIGDFNLPGIDWLDVRAACDSALRTTRECNILDLELTTSPEFVRELAVGEPFSDHFCLTFFLSGSLPRPRKSKKLVYAYRKADWEHLKSLFSHTPWHCAYFDDNLDDNWQAWLDLFFAAVDQCIPKRRHNNKFNPPWISRELLKLCGKKKLLFRKAKRVNTDLLGMRYRTLNNAVKKACNAAKGNYINDLAVELANNNNPKLFWSF